MGRCGCGVRARREDGGGAHEERSRGAGRAGKRERSGSVRRVIRKEQGRRAKSRGVGWKWDGRLNGRLELASGEADAGLRPGGCRDVRPGGG
jgi:hypothetical protein